MDEAAVDGSDAAHWASESPVLWAGCFPPPPPRPAHLQGAASDGVTTCDLCAWARAESTQYPPIDSGGIGWVMTLVIVSFISAALGAIIMMTIIRCRRQIQSNTGIAGNGLASSGSSAVALSSGTVRRGMGDDRASQRVKASLTPPPITENHYTHMEGAGTGLGEGQYASIGRQTGVYTNSAPSSAYYSELSAGDRAYESVDLAPSFPPSQTMPTAPASDYV